MDHQPNVMTLEVTPGGDVDFSHPLWWTLEDLASFAPVIRAAEEWHRGCVSRGESNRLKWTSGCVTVESVGVN